MDRLARRLAPTFGAQLHIIRKLCHVKPARLARLVGVSEPRYRALEMGDGLPPTPDEIARLAVGLAQAPMGHGHRSMAPSFQRLLTFALEPVRPHGWERTPRQLDVLDPCYACGRTTDGPFAWSAGDYEGIPLLAPLCGRVYCKPSKVRTEMLGGWFGNPTDPTDPMPFDAMLTASIWFAAAEHRVERDMPGAMDELVRAGVALDCARQVSNADAAERIQSALRVARAILIAR